METPLLASTYKAARAVGVSPAWLLAQAKSRRVPHLRADDVLLFNVDALRAHLLQMAARVPEPVASVTEEVACAH